METTAQSTKRWVPETRRRSHRVLLAVAGVLSGLVVTGVLMFAAAMQIFGYHVIEVSSGSMEPALRPGDVFVTRPVDIADVRKGDIVLFEQGRGTLIPVAHRVVSVVQIRTNVTDSETGKTVTDVSQVLRTKGDANPTPDSQYVDQSRLLGVLWFRISGVGALFGSFDVRHGLLVVALGIAVAWGVYEIVRLLRSRRASAG
jgi:signal peptidase